MPKHTYEPKSYDSMSSVEREGSHYPTVYLEVSADQVSECAVGEECMVKLRGKVVSISSHRHGSNIEIELKQSEVYGNNEYEKMAEDEA